MLRYGYRAIVIASLLSTSVSAVDNILTKKELQEIQNSSKTLNKPTIKVKDGMDRDSVYFLKLETKTSRGARVMKAFVDKKTGAVYIGRGYDKDGKEISFPKDIDIIKKGVSFSYGEGKKDLYLVTDPECPYCVKFEKASKGKLDEYRVHVILYPLPYHKKAPIMVEWIMQGRDDKAKRERLEQVMGKGSVEYKSLIVKPKEKFILAESTKRAVESAKEAMNELEVRGTPAIFDKDFNPVSWGQLLK